MRCLLYAFPRMLTLMPALHLLALMAAAADPGGWPDWRGVNHDGMARGDAPLHWGRTDRIEWTAPVPGRGHSSRVVWGARIFVTPAVPTGKVPDAAGQPAPAPPAGGRGPGGRGGFGSSGPQPEQKLMLLCFDRISGKLL